MAQTIEEAAELTYRRINAWSNPHEMNGIAKGWIISCIKEGLKEWAAQQEQMNEPNICIVQRPLKGSTLPYAPVENISLEQVPCNQCGKTLLQQIDGCDLTTCYRLHTVNRVKL